MAKIDKEIVSAAAKEAFEAARKGDFAAVCQIIKQYPNVSTQTDGSNNRWTLLHMYAGASQSNCVADLIAAGASTEARDAQMRTPLHLAARGGFPLPTNSNDNISVSPEKTVAALVLNRARVSARDSKGFTALHYAALAGNVTVIEYLLDLHLRPVGKRAGKNKSPVPYFRPRRAPIDAVSNLEDTPLHLACLGGHQKAIEALLKRGSDSERENYLGMRPIHRAVLGGDRCESLASAKLLLRKPWRVSANAQTYKGETPLYLAAKHGFSKQVGLLLQCSGGRNFGGIKVNCSIKSEKGDTPAECAKALGFLDIAKAIDASSFDPTRLAKKMGTITLNDDEVKNLYCWDE
eukprot:g5002.t1